MWAFAYQKGMVVIMNIYFGVGGWWLGDMDLRQYHANQFLPLSDDQIVKKVKEYLATCINGFRDAEVVDQAVVRFPKAVTHFFPGMCFLFIILSMLTPFVPAAHLPLEQRQCAVRRLLIIFRLLVNSESLQ